jgi:hypothetical protein
MKKQLLYGFVLISLIFLNLACSQGKNSLVGTWDTVSHTVDGKAVRTLSQTSDAVKGIVNQRIFTEDGHCRMIYSDKNGPMLTTPLNQLTKEELFSFFGQNYVIEGTYSVSGGKVIIKSISIDNPIDEEERAFSFRLDGAHLFLIHKNSKGQKEEITLRRAK